jgi:hypothetical protein
MIEKRTMGYVDFSYPNQKAKAVTVIFNTDTQKVELYMEDDDWYNACENTHFYDTVEQAEKALDDHKRELIAKMPEVQEYLDAMSNFEPDEDENSPFHFDRQDYLTYSLYHNKYDDGWSEQERKRLNKENKYLVNIIRTGFMNIYGYSFKVEDVESIRWGKKKAELVLKNGRQIKTCNEEEYNIVGYIFGNNVSRSTYSHLDEEEKD